MDSSQERETKGFSIDMGKEDIEERGVERSSLEIEIEKNEDISNHEVVSHRPHDIEKGNVEVLPSDERTLASSNVAREGDGGATAESRNSTPAKYSLDFWDSRFGSRGKIYLKVVIPYACLMLCALWGSLPLYWGSWYKEYHEPPHLNAWILNLDQSTIGNTITSALLSSNHGIHGPGTGIAGFRLWLGWEERISTSEDPWTLERVQHALHQEEVWAAVVIRPGTTEKTVAALNGQTPAPEFNTSDGIIYLYNQARNEQAAGNIINPIVTPLLQSITGNLSSQLVANYLTNISRNSNISSLLTTIPPSLLSAAVDYTTLNIHVWDTPVATVMEFVSLIYLMVFAFQWSMASQNFQPLIKPYLKLRSYIAVRLLTCIIYYAFVSLFFTLLNVAFGANLNRHFGHAGFVLAWVLLFWGVAALGLALEAMITIFTTKFIAPFFLLWMMSNISVVSIPYELQASVYKYGLGWPSYHVSHATRTILYGTRNTLGLNFSVVIAWALMSLSTCSLAMAWQRGREIKGESDRGEEREEDYGKRVAV